MPATVGVGWAAIPGSDGMIHGCYSTKGTAPLRVIDAEAGAKCAKNEKALNFNQRDPRGERGLQGNDGAPGKDGINGLDGKDGIDGKDGSPGSPTLWASVDADGTLRRGSHVVSAGLVQPGDPTDTGLYHVQFDRDITACAFTGTVGRGGLEPYGLHPATIRVSQGYTFEPVVLPDTVRVTTYRLEDESNSNGENSAQPFFVAVYC